MFVLNELKKSVKAFEDIIARIDKVDNISEFDKLEVEAQKVVFELQMKANQVAGEIVPQLHAKRTEMTTISADKVRERLANLQKQVKEKVKEKEENDGRSESDTINDNSGTTDSVSSANQSTDSPADPADRVSGERAQEPTEEPKEEVEAQEPTEEPKEEDGGNDNRQPAPESGNRKSKSAKKAK